MSKKYYLGLDIGTSSVGWAVTDENYNVLKAKGMRLWGSYLFKEGETAAERRKYRSNRRRKSRQKARIDYLQEIFADEIYKIDPSFFLRLNNSALFREDKGEWLGDKQLSNLDTKYSLFDDLNYTDYDFYKEHKTIYHLIQELIDNPNKKFDIRLIYLALHHLVKYRGHFLMEGVNLTSEGDSLEYLENLFTMLNEFLNERFDMIDSLFSGVSSNAFMNIFIKQKLTITQTKTELKKILNYQKNNTNEMIISALAGGKITISKMFEEESYKEIKPFTLYDSDFDDVTGPEIAATIGDDYVLIELLKSISSFVVMQKILGEGNTYLSEAMVKRYDQHQNDLKEFKKFIKRYYSSKVYNSLFREYEPKSPEVAVSYSQYIGMTKVKGIKETGKKVSPSNFYSAINKLLDNQADKFKDDEVFNINKNAIKEKISQNDFLPLMASKENASLPYQLNILMAEKILENASKHYDFLNEKEKNLKNKEKIIRLITFRIPYYVGPLNDQHQGEEGVNNWLVRRDVNDKTAITPFNLDEKVDLVKTQEKFIRRMTNKCTFLPSEDVLPKASLCYEEYDILNRINRVKINGELISKQIKSSLLEYLKSTKSLTLKQFQDWLIRNGFIRKEDENPISGIDLESFKLSTPSHYYFSNIIKDPKRFKQLNNELEQVIFWSTIFEDAELLKKQIKVNYSDEFTPDEIEKLARFKGAEWGRLSATFLAGKNSFYINDESTGVLTSIIEILRDSNKELNSIIYDDSFNVREAIQEFNSENQINYASLSQRLDDSYVSPQVKRSIVKTIRVIDDLEKVLKVAPTKIFVEVARGGGKKGERKSSRKTQLLKLYEAAKVDAELINQLNNQGEETLKSKRLYLYYLQLGKCAYSGETIDLNTINSNAYDIDHIYPQSKIKDDSFTNLVLVKRAENMRKSDGLVPHDVRIKQKAFWKALRKKQLINEEKLNRLMRSYPLTEQELSDFVNRQIVTTQQSTRVVIDILSEMFPDTEIVYAKAGNVSDFRRDFDIIKVRNINNLHHAKDAYLNVVVGNVYNVKFTKNPRNFMETGGFKENYNLKNLYKYDIKGAWNAKESNSLKLVKKTMERNDVSVVRATETFSTPNFYDQNASKASEKGLAPIKEYGPLKDSSKYGGYNSVSTAYFVLVESKDKKGKTMRTLEAMPTMYARRAEKSENFANWVCTNYFGLEDPSIIKKINIFSEITIAGFPVLISGKSNDQILLYNSVELFLNKDEEKYIKSLEKIDKDKSIYSQVEEIILNEVIDLETNLIKTNSIIVNKEKNLLLYNVLIKKFKNKIFEGTSFYRYGTTLENGKENFISLSLLKQVSLLLQCIRALSAKSAPSGDLRLIGGTGSVSLGMNKKINKTTILRTYSPTGLYNKKEILFKEE